jgi:8-oxo-dGTP pyrophosphatase MutT (NUDIX family)
METTPSSITNSVIQAAGGILHREISSGDEVLIVHRKRYGDWTLPKGKLKPGESFTEAALREVEEETGCSVHLGEYLGAIGYPVGDRPKVVLFWRMSVKEQNAIKDTGEVKEVTWLRIADAMQRLTHDAERALLSRIFSSTRPYQSPQELSLPQRPGRSPWFQSTARSHARLLREFEVFRVELAFLEQRSQGKHSDWIPATQDQLRKVEHYLKQKDGIEGGWLCLSAARRYMLFGLSSIELSTQAAILREETQKVSSWRGKVMKNVLAIPDDQLTADRVKEAMALRDEYAANQYHKVWLTGDQLIVLLKLCGITVPLLLPLIVFFSRHPEDVLPQWGYQMVAAVLFFGLLGAAFSVAQSLIKDTNQSRIMERVANHFVTIARTLFGAVAGLAGYAFLESKVLNITIGADNSTGGALAIAFLFGYAGERLIASVAGTFSSNKP